MLGPWAHPLGAAHGLNFVSGSPSPGEKPQRLKGARHRQDEDVMRGPASAVHRHTPTASWACPSAGRRHTEAPTHTLLTMWQPPCHRGGKTGVGQGRGSEGPQVFPGRLARSEGDGAGLP